MWWRSGKGPDVGMVNRVRPTPVGRTWGEHGANLGRTGFAPPPGGESGANPLPIFGRVGAGHYMGATINREPKRENVLRTILDPPHPPTMLGKGCTRVFGVGGANRPLFEGKYY